MIQGYKACQQLMVIIKSTRMKADLYRHLPDGCYELKEEHLDDVKVLMADAFLSNNKIWSSAQLDRDQLIQFFHNVILEHLESQEQVRRDGLPHAVINFIYVINGKLISCLLHQEIAHYRRLQKNYKESHIPLFRELERQGRELIKCVDIDKMEQGKYIYCTWTAHVADPEHTRLKKAIEVATTYDAIRSQGFEGMICRSSNFNVIQILSILGGELLKQSDFHLNNKTFKLFFAMLHLQNDAIRDFIERTRREKEEQPMAKL